MTNDSVLPADAVRRLLAVSYVLPPALYPQSIQIGRLLTHSRHVVGEVCSSTGQPTTGIVPRTRGTSSRLVISDTRPRLPSLHRLALRALPLYGAVPDEHRTWAVRAGRDLMVSPWLKDLAPDVIVTFGEPMSDHVLGLSLKQATNLPWIAHFSDPWADNPFRRPHKMAGRLNTGLEMQVVSAADALVFTSQETTTLFCDKYGPRLAAKAHTLPHSLEPALYRKPAAAGGGKDGPLVARYLGNFYGHRTPLPVLRALARLAATQPEVARRIRVEFVGGMPGWMRLYPEMRRVDPEQVRFLASVDYQRSLDLMVGADLLLVIDAPAKNSPFLPSKLVDYLGAGRPILGAVPPGPSQRLIERIGGWTADPRDTEAIAAALVEFVTNPTRRADIAARAGAVAEEYTAPRIAARFDDIVSAVAAGCSAREVSS